MKNHAFYCLLLVGSFLLITSTPLCAQDHLSPDVDSLNDKGNYNANLRVAFSDGLGDDVVLRVLVISAFSGEYMIGIRKKKNGFELFKLKAKDGFIGEDPLLVGKVIDNVQSQGRDLPVSEVNEIQEIWQKALLDVRRGSSRITLDGESFRFSMFVQGYGVLSGHIDSPEPGSKMQVLTDLVKGLDKFVSNSIGLNELNRHIADVVATENEKKNANH